MRNVRSRPALDLDSNHVRTHLSSYSSHTFYPTSHPVEHSSSVDISGQSSNAISREGGHLRTSPTHGRILPEDSNDFNNDINRFPGGSATNASLEVGAPQHDFISGRNPVLPQGFYGNSTISPSEEGMQVVSESYSSRHPQSSSALTWRNNERNGRTRISHDRYRSLADDAAFHGRFSSQGSMIADNAAFYGSRNMFDQHRDMRLNIDNMTYEAWERIGSVNTGLSEDSISKCLAETIYHCSDQYQDESSCVICLEDYKDMDEIGALKTCGHKYHAPCIKKWLSMKNTCPICKASVVADDTREK
ncbi:RING/U-box domain-containing protein [Hibiscus syriacus]|uniref:RING-type E3 ubiquitin transferase n=1 Tax=Hibiscus syriacus TaxID=106335 RepID=A0A6A3AMZ9_HIBSY|nr:RING/U-box domain-containing protein [Hibiscus syriacus]